MVFGIRSENLSEGQDDDGVILAAKISNYFECQKLALPTYLSLLEIVKINLFPITVAEIITQHRYLKILKGFAFIMY